MISDFEDKLREALIASINDVSETTLSMAMPVTKDKPDIKGGGQVICCVRLGGILNSTFALVASGESVCKLASKVLGNEITELNQDATHVIGEMAMKIGESIVEKLKDEEFGFDVEPVETIDDTKFDEIKGQYMLAIRKCFVNEILGIDTSLMYQMPKEGEEAQEPADDASEESAEEQPQEQKKEGDPQVILDVLEKEGHGPATIVQPAEEVAISDDLMSEAMKKLEEVINEIRTEGKPRISIKAEAGSEAASESETEVALQEIDTSVTLDSEEPPTLAPQESEEPPTLADSVPPPEEAPSPEAESSQEDKPQEEPPSKENLSEADAPSEPPPGEEPPQKADQPPADASGGEETSSEESPQEEPPKEENPPEDEKPAEGGSSPEADQPPADTSSPEEPPSDEPPKEES